MLRKLSNHVCVIGVSILILGCAFNSTAEGKTKASIVQLTKEKQIDYGVGRLNQELERQGAAVTEEFIVGLKSEPAIKKHLTEADKNCKELQVPEGFVIKRVSQGQVLIAGNRCPGNNVWVLRRGGASQNQRPGWLALFIHVSPGVETSLISV